MSKQDPRTRLNYGGKLEPVFKNATSAYGIGNFLSYEAIPYGYEDFNAIVFTDEGRFVAKVFASSRLDSDIERYEKIMTAVMEGGVNHPHMYSAYDNLVYEHPKSGLSMVMMDFVAGETFYEAKRVPNSQELDKILKQAVNINQLDILPKFLSDSWAIPNIRENFLPIQDKVSIDDKVYVDSAITDLEKIDIDKLPHCFVHGDLVKSNVLKGNDDEIYILDFSVANWYPRIQELAVIVGNLVNSAKSRKSFEDVLKNVMTRYVVAGGEFTTHEMNALPSYTRAAYAAEFVGASRERILNHNTSKENDYWLRLGRAGLRRATIG